MKQPKPIHRFFIEFVLMWSLIVAVITVALRLIGAPAWLQYPFLASWVIVMFFGCLFAVFSWIDRGKDE